MEKADKRKTTSVESALTVVLRHPIRVLSMTILAERVASPKEIADLIGETTGHVAYHVKELFKAGFVEVVDTQPVRGAVQTFYKATEFATFSDEEWESLPLEERRDASRFILQLAAAEAAASIERGLFDARHDRYLVRSHGDVDARGWSELNALHGEVLERTKEIVAGSANRIADDEDPEVIRVSVISMFFERFTGA